MELTKDKVLNILRYLDENPNFYFPFKIICKDFNENNELFDVNCLDIKSEYVYNNKSMNTFMLKVNLQRLDKETTKLMAKGFIDKIENISALDKISNLAIQYKKNWQKNLCDSEYIEKYGENEFFGGKAEAFEDCMQIVEKHLLTS